MRLMANPEAKKVKFLVWEVEPDKLALRGFFLLIAGIWAGNAPCLAIPAILVGSGMMVYSTRKIEQQNRQTSLK